jgi:predicted aldo/keto reductase-like oxidoreductase
MTIETRRLGRTGTDVTILGYGAMELRGQPHGQAIDDDDAGRLLNEVLDGGINLIDTSKRGTLGQSCLTPSRRIIAGQTLRDLGSPPGDS